MGLLAAWLPMACTSVGDYKQEGQSVTVHVAAQEEGDARLVRFEVMGERIIRVSATPERSFADPTSLVVVPREHVTPYTVARQGDTISLQTAALTASVIASTGEVRFTDRDGKVILAEPQGGGKQFTPIRVDETEGYTIRQVFDSPDDEAFYGLGQHQADEFNYKGKNEELFQYNTKVSLPFVVSTRGYGLLLDSYSLCRFGNPRDYDQLHRLFRLYDKEGVKGALTGTYTPQRGETVVRREDSLYFENLKTIRNLPEKFPLYGSSVLYEGAIEPRESGEFKFILYYAGYVRVFIDDREVVAERWRTAWNPNAYKFAVTLEAGRRVPIRVEWRPDGGESYCGLRALAPVDPQQQGQHSWWSEMTRQLDYYLIAGEDMDEIISGYRTLTGKSQVMPRWAMGYWQSRERYKTADELLANLAEFRRRRLPIDNIVLDWNYWPEEAWGSHDFDAARFADPRAMVDSVHARHARLMISVWPKFYVDTEHFRQFDKRGWMYRQAVRDSLKDWIGQGYHYSFYDAYSPDARRLFWQQMKEKLYPLGIDAWWMDASEPNIRDCTDLPYRKALCGPTALGSSTEFFNAYALMNAEAIYDGQRSAGGVDETTPTHEGKDDRRVFLLTRSGFSGLQRYGTATWSGDIATRWEDMKAQISAGLNFSISGIPYWTMDIGGFCVEKRYEKAWKEYKKTGRENEDLKEWRELNTRWYQFGAFVPLFRAHGQYPPREPWNIAPEEHPAYRSIAYYLRLRYRLLPYLYSLAGRTHFEDYTLMRPLVMDYSADLRVRDIGDQFLLGPSLMVSPIYRYGDRTRTLYFPETPGGWYDFYSGKRVSSGGEMCEVEAPYERIPLHVPAGTILPLGKDLQWSDEQPMDQITLLLYTGADAHFTLYDDAGTDYGYERGEYARIPISYNEADHSLTIGARQGSFPTMPERITLRVIPISPEHPYPWDADPAGGIVIDYDGTLQNYHVLSQN